MDMDKQNKIALKQILHKLQRIGIANTLSYVGFFLLFITLNSLW